MTDASAVSLSVRHWGSGPRRALLLHGIGSSSAGWWRLGPQLADIGYRVVAADLRGHGASPKRESMRLEDYVADVVVLGERWDFVVAHSLGGTIVLAGGLGNSDWTDRLVLQEPAVIGRDDPEVMAWLLSEYDGAITPESVARSNPTWHPTDAAFKAEALIQSGPEVVHRTLAGTEGWNLWDELMAVSVPTLLIGADPDLGALVPPVMGEEAAKGNPMVRYEMVRGGSHSMHRDEYDAYWGLIGDFAI